MGKEISLHKASPTQKGFEWREKAVRFAKRFEDDLSEKNEHMKKR
jgi:hypothetical protein